MIANPWCGRHSPLSPLPLFHTAGSMNYEFAWQKVEIVFFFSPYFPAPTLYPRHEFSLGRFLFCGWQKELCAECFKTSKIFITPHLLIK